MPSPDYVASNSSFFEAVQEHRFIFDVAKNLATQVAPRSLSILKPDVDMFGYDLVLSIGGTIRYIQLKARSGGLPSNPYDISENIWGLPGGCVVWINYSRETLEPNSYYLLGAPLPTIGDFPVAERPQYRKVKMRQANHRNITVDELTQLLFPVGAPS